MSGLEIETGVCGNDQEGSFMNATLQSHGELEFSIATYVSVPDEITSEGELQSYLTLLLGGLLYRADGKSPVSFEVQLGPAGSGDDS